MKYENDFKSATELDDKARDELFAKIAAENGETVDEIVSRYAMWEQDREMSGEADRDEWMSRAEALTKDDHGIALSLVEELARMDVDPFYKRDGIGAICGCMTDWQPTECKRELSKHFTDAQRKHKEKMKAKKAHRSASKGAASTNAAGSLPVSVTLQLKTMLESVGVEGDSLEDGRALRFKHNDTTYTVRDARLFGHASIVEPKCDPLQTFADLLMDIEPIQLDADAAFSSAFPSLARGAYTDDHSIAEDVAAILPDDLAAPNLDVLRFLLLGGRVDVAGASNGIDELELMEVFRLNAEYALVNVGGEPRAYTRKTGQRHSVQSLNLTDRRQAELQRRGDKKAKWYQLAEVWKGSMFHVYYDGVGLYPLGYTVRGERYLDDPATRQHFNLWRGFAVEPRQGDWSLMREHLLRVVCGGNETYFNYFLDWLAQRVQRPWQIPGVAIVLFGKKGCGKSIVGKYFARIFGDHAEVMDKSHHVVGQFTNFAEDKLLVVLEEALFSKDPRHVNATKHMITSDKQTVEVKYEQQRSVNCSPGFIFCSNSDEPVHVTPDERRFLALLVSPEKIGDKAYFTALCDQMDNGGVAAMLYDLQHRNISNFDPMGDMPYTKYLSDMVLRSLEGEDRAMLNVLKTGEVNGNMWPEDTPFVIKTEALCEAFERYTGRRYENRSDLTSLGIKLSEWGLVRHKIPRSTARAASFELVSLKLARELMATAWRVDVHALEFGEIEETNPFEVAREYAKRAAMLAGVDLLASDSFRKFLDDIAQKERGDD